MAETMPIMKLYYWDVPGYAEVSRLLLTGGNIPFENVFLTQDTWKDFKPKTPFGKVPVLEVEGEFLAESHAIAVFCAKAAGFYPDTAKGAARADEVCLFMRDMFLPFQPTWMIADFDERMKAREALLGPFKEQLTVLQNYLAGKEFVAGDKLSYGDLAVFVDLSMYTSEMMEGMPATILDGHPGLKAFRNKVAKVDFVRKYYADGKIAAFRPDPEP